jgi:hypothetical protein
MFLLSIWRLPLSGEAHRTDRKYCTVQYSNLSKRMPLSRRARTRVHDVDLTSKLEDIHYNGVTSGNFFTGRQTEYLSDMAVQSRIAAVTGANRGIGLAIGKHVFLYPAHTANRTLPNRAFIVRNLALQYPDSPLKSGPFLIYLTARSAERGEEAVETLSNDPQLKKAKVLVQDGGDTTIKFQALDISDQSSIRAFRDFIKETHEDGIDVLINNAGIGKYLPA